MAGLLDSYQVDPLAQGLLGLSGALLTPRSQGGGIGAGFQAFNGGMLQAQQMQRQMQQDALRQRLLQSSIDENSAQAEERKFKLKMLQDEQDRRARIAKRLSEGVGMPQGAQPAPMQQADMPLSLGAGGGLLGPQGAEMPSVPSPMFGTGPQAQSQPQGARPSRLDSYKRLMFQASAYQAEGDMEGALKLQELAQNSLPELKEQARVLVNGKPTLRLVFKDGTYEDITDAAPTANVESLNFGGYRQNQNKDTGQLEGPQTAITMDEAQRAANARALEQLGISRGQLGVAQGNLSLSRERLNFERDSGGKPTWDSTLSMWVTRPSASNPTGRAMAPIGTDGQPVARPDKAPTEAQSKDNLFARRAIEAEQAIVDLGSKPNVGAVGFKQGVSNLPVIGGLAGTLANAPLSEESQKYDQAKRNFINAVLRKESGAVIGPDEFKSADLQYFPQPFDSAAVKAQKAKNRRTAIEGIASGAGPLGRDMPAIPTAPAQPAIAPNGTGNPMSGALPGGQRVMRFDAQGNLVQ